MGRCLILFEIFLFSKGREGAKSAEIVWSHRYPSMQMNQGQNPISQKSIPAVKAKPRLIFMIKRKCQAKSKLLQVGINLAQFNTVKVQMLLKITWESLIGTLFSRKSNGRTWSESKSRELANVSISRQRLCAGLSYRELFSVRAIQYLFRPGHGAF